MTPTIALVGQPNAGKSTLFNVLSDIKTSTSNFAGTTVSTYQADINALGQTYHLIDLPGIYSLNAADKAEEVTLDYIQNNQIDLIINVVDASLLARSLELTIELAELGLPMIIALNMLSEAENHGVRIDTKKFENILNLTVVPISALHGKGVSDLIYKGSLMIRSNIENSTKAIIQAQNNSAINISNQNNTDTVSEIDELTSFARHSVQGKDRREEIDFNNADHYTIELPENDKPKPVKNGDAYNKSNHRVIPDEITSKSQFSFSHGIEKIIGHLTSKIINSGFTGRLSPRYYAIKSIENPDTVPQEILKALEPDLVKINRMIEAQHKDRFEIISYERHHLTMKMAETITTLVKRKERPFLDKVDDLLLSPVFGYFFLVLFFLVYFGIIFFVGGLLGDLISIPISHVSGLYEPLKSTMPFLWSTIDGCWQGIAGLLGIVLPYFLPLIFLTSVFEETGYLARIAFLLDGIFHKIGLHGKSVASFILGIGCSVPAIYATRIIESKRDRIVTAALIPFIPCSARISVIFALTAAFAGPLWAFVIFFYVLFIIAFNGKLLSLFLSKPIGLILEIPALKLPSYGIAFTKTWVKARQFASEVFIFLIVGSIVLSWLEYFNISAYINYAFSPILKSVLGLPDALGSTLVFGFFRKELIIVMASQALGVSSLANLPLTAHQVIVFLVFVTFYFPCLSTFIVLVKEFGAKVGFLTALLSLAVALGSAFIFKIALTFI